MKENVGINAWVKAVGILLAFASIRAAYVSLIRKESEELKLLKEINRKLG